MTEISTSAKVMSGSSSILPFEIVVMFYLTGIRYLKPFALTHASDMRQETQSACVAGPAGTKDSAEQQVPICAVRLFVT